MSKRGCSDRRLYTMLIVSKLLSSEIRHWFLAAVLARGGPHHKGNAPHRLMNLHTLLSVAKGRMSSVVLADLKGAIHEALESTNERYVIITISLMCAVFLTELLAERMTGVLSTPSPTTLIQQWMPACSS